jgi:hypothetical protein
MHIKMLMALTLLYFISALIWIIRFFYFRRWNRRRHIY